jgi:hypothetical protein
VIVLDENILESQRLLLHSSRIRARQIGVDFAHKGIGDSQILRRLHEIKLPTFFTRDLSFYAKDLCHSGYCLVALVVHRQEAASFIRRVLRHQELRTRAQRMGKVRRVSTAAIHYWELNAEEEGALDWE